MTKLARNQKGSGSALNVLGLIWNITTTFLHPLLNQRGMAGDQSDDPTNPGEDALEHDSPDDAEGGEDKTPEPSGQEQPKDADKDQEPEDSEPSQEEPQKAADAPDAENLQQQISQLQAQLQQANQMAEFYGNFYRQSQQPQQPQQQPVQGPQQPPEGIINPGDWDSQEQTANWVNHTVKSELQQGYQQMVLPALQMLSKAIQGLQMTVAKSNKEDWDDIYNNTIGEIFTTAPDGNVIGIKNQSLLEYFRAQANPYEAMYQYGLTRATPQKIKQKVQQHSKKVLESIGNRPKGPTQPKTSGKPEAPDAELDWDTPPEKAEKILAKRGLI